MKLRELIGEFDIRDILGFINKFGRENFHTMASEIGPIDYYDFTSLEQTYNLLKGDGSGANDSTVADKYTVRFSWTYARKHGSKKPDLVPFCGIYDKTADLSIHICREYVKNIGDFAECEVELVETLPELTMAGIAVLSFMVVEDEFYGRYGEGRADEYIRFCYNYMFKPQKRK